MGEDYFEFAFKDLKYRIISNLDGMGNGGNAACFVVARLTKKIADKTAGWHGCYIPDEKFQFHGLSLQ